MAFISLANIGCVIVIGEDYCEIVTYICLIPHKDTNFQNILCQAGFTQALHKHYSSFIKLHKPTVSRLVSSFRSVFPTCTSDPPGT
jgi:hypothetical protein